MTDAVESSHLKYAGLWKRTCGYVLDSVLCGMVVLAVYLATMFGLLVVGVDGAVVAMALAVIATVVLNFTYFAISESSIHQATLGKRAVGLKVVDSKGERLTYPRALARNFALGISLNACFVGILIMLATKRKQCLHDIIANCLVIERQENQVVNTTVS